MKEVTFLVGDDPVKNVEFNDGINDGEKVRDVALVRCVLKDKHLKKVTFEGGRIESCRVERSNLRYVRMQGVDLTGTVFTDCNLQYATFEFCNMRYVSFKGCYLNYDSALNNQPREANLRRLFLQSLRLNAMSMGDGAIATNLLVLELAANRDELVDIVVGRTEHERRKYSGWQRVGAARSLCGWWAQRMLWGHGLALWNVAFSGIAVVLLFAALYSFTPSYFLIEGVEGESQLTSLRGVYYSLISFTIGGPGDIMPANSWARAITGVEGLLGVIFLGFFAAAAYRRLAK
jgi:hypothetical protein